MMVPLSVPEVRRLFHSGEHTPHSAIHRLAWSFWRRAHQAIARLCHSKRRLAFSHSVTTVVLGNNGVSSAISDIHPLRNSCVA